MNLLFAIQLFLFDGDDLIVGIEFHACDRAIRIFDGTDVTFLRAFNHGDKDTNEPVSQAAAHARSNHTACDDTTTHSGVHF